MTKWEKLVNDKTIKKMVAALESYTMGTCRLPYLTPFFISATFKNKRHHYEEGFFTHNFCDIYFCFKRM